MLNDTAKRYGSVSRFFHWLVAILVIEQFIKFSKRINEGHHWLWDTFGPWHNDIGVIILVLVILRLLWTWKQKHQRPVNAGIEGVLAKIVHAVFYICLLVMPFLGALYIHGKGYAVKLFGCEVLAKPAAEVDWALALGNFHSPLAILLVVLVVGHVGAALYHHLVRKDDVLQRML